MSNRFLVLATDTTRTASMLETLSQVVKLLEGMIRIRVIVVKPVSYLSSDKHWHGEQDRHRRHHERDGDGDAGAEVRSVRLHDAPVTVNGCNKYHTL